MEMSMTLDIAAIERDTGIKKDTLRKWEQRYGFPSPHRSSDGERMYSLQDLHRLILIKRLIDQGYRPKNLVILDESALEALLASTISSGNKNNRRSEWAVQADAALMAMVHSHDMLGLRRTLRSKIAGIGLAATIEQLISPVVVQVGEDWLSGKLSVFQEHLFTDSLVSILREALGVFDKKDAPIATAPNVLLTTFPNELHGIGLLMAECFFALAGCKRFSLGCGMPLVEIEKAVLALKIDIVAISFSAHESSQGIVTGLRQLRERLPEQVELWVGGNAPVIHQRKIASGIRGLRGAAAILDAVSEWRDNT